MAAFKRFRFYEVDINESLGLPEGVTCSALHEAGTIALGFRDGAVLRLLPERWDSTTFQAYGGPLHAVSWFEKDTLVTVGEESHGAGAGALTLKVWGPLGDRLATETPTLISSVRLFSGRHAPSTSRPILAVGVHVSALEWPNVHVAVALAGGAVHVLKFEQSKGRVVPLAGSPVALEDGADAVFVGISPTPSVGTLWAVTPTHTAAYALPSAERRVLDARGAASPDLVALSSSRLAVAGPEVVSFYTVEEGQTSALALQGEKLGVWWGGRHLMVASAERAHAGLTPVSPSSPMTPPVSHSLVRVFDPEHKLLAGQATISGSPRWACTSRSWFAVGTAAGGVLRFQKVPLQRRLEGLCRAQAFALAASLAAAEGAGPEVEADVRLRFGDALYTKRDYDAALRQYVATIGYVEASYVIQRFLAVQRLSNLTDYLEALRCAGLAGPDHLTLLLSCYARRGDTARVDAFVEALEHTLLAGDERSGAPRHARRASGASSAAGPGPTGPETYDVPAVVRVCRQAGYYDDALRAAHAAGDDETALEVLTDDLGNWDAAVLAMRKLGRRRAAEAILRHGKGLLQHVPVKTTALLMELCVPAPPRLPAGPPGAGAHQEPEDGSFVASLGNFTHLYADRPEDLRYACLTILNLGAAAPEAQARLYILLLELSLSSSVPRLAGHTEDTAPWRRGFRLAEQQRQDALDLLKRGWPTGQEAAYDVGEALVTCRTHGFYQGAVFLYESSGQYRLAGSVLRDVGDDAGAVALCRRRGDPALGGDASLWYDTLEHFAAGTGPEAARAVGAFLELVEEARVLPPLTVLRVLSRNRSFTLGLLREYVARQLAADDAALERDDEETARLEEEVEATRRELTRLETEPLVVQPKRDALTDAPLELPSVHFYCGHSFNASTLGDAGAGDEPVCPLCAADHAQAAAIGASNRAWAGDKDTFFKRLRASGDGFSVIADYFSKGVLNSTSVSSAPLLPIDGTAS